MTNEEAIRRMECCRNFLKNNYSDMGEPNITAFNMAIKALEQETVIDEIRAEIEDIAFDWQEIDGEHESFMVVDLNDALQIIDKNRENTLDEIEDLPSVTPQPKVGEWLEKEVIDNSYKVIEEWQSARCSVCDRYHTTPYMYYFDNYKFCPNCGARMEVET